MKLQITKLFGIMLSNCFSDQKNTIQRKNQNKTRKMHILKTLGAGLLSLTASVFIIAQEYIPFPTENAHWNIYFEYGVGPWGTMISIDTFLLRYSLEGDTIINDKSYIQVIKETGDTINPHKEIIGALREDSMRIYYQGEDYLGERSDMDILLYDFSRSVNDTIYHFFLKPELNYLNSVIVNIDSVWVGIGYRKRYEIEARFLHSMHQTEYWIEGIGSIRNGLFGHIITSIPTCEYHYYWEHVCYKDQYIEFVNPNFTSCYPAKFFTGITDHHNNSSKVVAFPNPVGSVIHIRNIEQSSCLVNIYCNNGTLIYTKTHFPAGQQIEIKTDLAPGVYILELLKVNGDVISLHTFIR